MTPGAEAGRQPGMRATVFVAKGKVQRTTQEEVPRPDPPDPAGPEGGP
jgi:hypothetical protein